MSRLWMFLACACAYTLIWGAEPKGAEAKGDETPSAAAEEEYEILPRNPFWPQNYEGVRYPITKKPRFKHVQAEEEPEVGSAEAEEAAKARRRAARLAAQKADAAVIEAENKRWKEARKALKFGAMMNFSTATNTRATVSINGRIYTAGDLISTNVGESRFTWAIDSLTEDGKLKLKPLQYRPIGKNQ